MTERAGMSDHDRLVLVERDVNTLGRKVDDLRGDLRADLQRIHDAIALQRDWRNRQLGALSIGGMLLAALGALIAKGWDKLFT